MSYRNPFELTISSGCPQGIAKRGGYGAFLQDDWKLITSLSRLHTVAAADDSINPSQEPVNPSDSQISDLSRRRENNSLCQNDGSCRCSDFDMSWADEGDERSINRIGGLGNHTTSETSGQYPCLRQWQYPLS